MAGGEQFAKAPMILTIGAVSRDTLVREFRLVEAEITKLGRSDSPRAVVLHENLPEGRGTNASR